MQSLGTLHTKRLVCNCTVASCQRHRSSQEECYEVAIDWVEVCMTHADAKASTDVIIQFVNSTPTKNPAVIMTARFSCVQTTAYSLWLTDAERSDGVVEPSQVLFDCTSTGSQHLHDALLLDTQTHKHQSAHYYWAHSTATATRGTAASTVITQISL